MIHPFSEFCSPINLIDDHEQRWAYAAVFAIITYKVLSLFDGVLFWTPEAFNDPEWMKKYGWTEGNQVKLILFKINILADEISAEFKYLI